MYIIINVFNFKIVIMKKQLRLWGMIPFILLGLAACNKDDATTQDQGTGEVKIAFGFDKAAETKAPVNNTKRPVTSWTKSVKDLMILFVSGDKVLDARTIPAPAAADLSEQTFTFDKVPVMTGGDIYIVANSGETAGIVRKSETGGSWTPATVKNQTFSKLYLELVAAAATTPEEFAGETKYKQPAEIFLAHKGGVNITADQTTNIADALHLTRAVSLVRVRLKPVDANDTKISFVDPKALVYLRKANPKMKLTGVASGHGPKIGIFVPKPFLNAEPAAADYTGTEAILNAAGGIKYYQDILTLPGGGSASADKFEVVIKGITTAEYTLPDGTKLAAGKAVYWSGAFDMEAEANGIVILTVTVNSQGVETPPAPGNFGSLSIKVDMADWGSVESGEIVV